MHFVLIHFDLLVREYSCTSITFRIDVLLVRLEERIGINLFSMDIGFSSVHKLVKVSQFVIIH